MSSAQKVNETVATEEERQMSESVTLKSIEGRYHLTLPSHIDSSAIDAFYDHMVTIEEEQAHNCLVFHLEAGKGREVGQLSPEILTLTPNDALRAFTRLGKAVAVCERLTKQTVLILSGQAGPVALDLALVCDIRIAQQDTEFLVRELHRGVLPGTALYRMARAFGPRVAKRMLVAGHGMGAQEAQQIGLLDGLVRDVGEALPSAVQRLEGAPGFVLSLARRLLDEAPTQDSYRAFEAYKAAQYEALMALHAK